MKFPFQFQRQKGGSPAGTPALGSDNKTGVSGSVPKDGADSGGATKQDNFYSSKIFASVGWPVHRVAVTYTTDAATPVSLNARMYLFLDNTQSWYQLGAQVALAVNQVSFFDVLAVMEMATTSKDLLNMSPGAPRLQLVVDDPGATAHDGLYTFCMAPDLTTQA